MDNIGNFLGTFNGWYVTIECNSPITIAVENAGESFTEKL